MHIGTTVHSPMDLIEVSVLENGVPLDIYKRPSDGALFVPAVVGRAYVLHVRNLRPARLEIINSVDGRNTLKDEAASAYHSQGLIFGAHSGGDFTGWRTSREGTRKFIFGSPERSVAARSGGDAGNVGVIGFAVWREHSWTPVHNLFNVGVRPGASSATFASASASASVAAAAAPVAVRSVGTEIGEWQADKIGTTHFTRDSGEPDILTIQYDTIAALRKMGITGPAEPSAFPVDDGGYDKTTGYGKY